jgi:pyruvate formate lyase activating enzyme
MQGCNLRCGCCHNPDTWSMKDGKEYTPEEIIAKAVRFREYFGSEGGITLSGGEPILQAEFAKELFSLAHREGINTCLDTSGSILNNGVKALLSETDRVLLDIKYIEEELYLKHVGCKLSEVLNFLEYLNEKSIPTTLRQVIIPNLNDTESSITELSLIASRHSCVDKIEFLPFKKICALKYENMKIAFPFNDYPTPTQEQMKKINELLNKKLLSNK